MACQNATHPERQRAKGWRELQWKTQSTGSKLSKPAQMVLKQPTIPTRTKARRNTCVTGVLSRERWTQHRRLHRPRLDANRHRRSRTPHSWIGMDKPHHSDHLIPLCLGMIRPGSTRRPIWSKGLRRLKFQAWGPGRSCINRHHRIQTMASRPLITISRMATRVLTFRLMQATVVIHLNHLLTAVTTQDTDHPQ
jgi:hypothetical protein